MSGWDPIGPMLQDEWKQCIEEGVPAEVVAVWKQEGERLVDRPEELLAWYGRLRPEDAMGARAGQEPSGLAEIRSQRPAADASDRRAVDLEDARLAERLHGAWLGRCIGCALGKPVEGFMDARLAPERLSSRERLRRYVEAIGPEEWPLRDYVPGRSPAEDVTGRTGCPLSTREEIAFAETDDDLRYTVLSQIVVEGRGREMTTRDVAEAWARNLPLGLVCTAETQAYRNMTWRYGHPRAWPSDGSMDWGWVARHQNPYREWIGAQIRADGYGYVCPGDSELAAELAWRDSRLSHVKNGLYGAMWVAAMTAAALGGAGVEEAIRAGLGQVPRGSRLAAAIEQSFVCCDAVGRDPDRFEEVFAGLDKSLGGLHPVHTNNNAAVVSAALLLGAGDFHRTVTIAVMGGLDTDCNGATAGSVCGAVVGAGGIPLHWSARLHDTLRSGIVGYEELSIRDCSRWSLDLARKVRSGS